MEFSKVFLVALLPLLFIPAFAQEADSESQIPPWVKGVFNFWVDGGIEDSELMSAIEFLIEEDIIELHENQTETEDTTEKDKEIQELTEDLEELETEFQQYKKDNRFNKIPVDGDSDSEDTVKNLKHQLEDKEHTIEELEEKIKKLEKEIDDDDEEEHDDHDDDDDDDDHDEDDDDHDEDED